MGKILTTIIKTYRYLISPLLGQNCRFYPSCSKYAEQAINTHGAIKGGWLMLKRVGRCHPFCAGGLDPVPAITTNNCSKVHTHTEKNL